MTAIRTRTLSVFAALCAAAFATAAPASASAPPTEPTAERSAIGVISPPPPADACVTLTRALHPGDDDGDDGAVSCLQEQLLAAQIPLVEPTGVFDEATRLAVATWQTLNGLTVDGWVGAQTAPTLGFTWDPPAPPAAAPAPPAEPDNGSDAASTGGSDDTPTDPQSCLDDVRAGASAVAQAMNMPLATIQPGDLGGNAGWFWGASDLSFGDITVDCSATPIGGWFGLGAHEQAHWVVLSSTGASGPSSECATESVAFLLTGSDSGFYSPCDQQGQHAIDQFFFYWG